MIAVRLQITLAWPCLTWSEPLPNLHVICYHCKLHNIACIIDPIVLFQCQYIVDLELNKYLDKEKSEQNIVKVLTKLKWFLCCVLRI